MLPQRPYLKSHLGLTLVEVLIALAIVAIAMTAVIKATSQNIRSTNYLQDKMGALWVAQSVLNEVKAGVLMIPNGDDLTDQTRSLGKDWFWKVSQTETSNKSIQRVEVNVYPKENEEAQPIITLESYVQHAETN